VSAPLSVEANDEVVAKEEFVVFWPKIEPDCCAEVLPQEGSVEPLFEPTVTVDPKLGSVFRPGVVDVVFEAPPNADFCCPRPAKPDWPPLALPKLEKPEPAPEVGCPNLAKPEEPA
jgi:hypothetical protein